MAPANSPALRITYAEQILPFTATARQSKSIDYRAVYIGPPGVFVDRKLVATISRKNGSSSRIPVRTSKRKNIPCADSYDDDDRGRRALIVAFTSACDRDGAISFSSASAICDALRLRTSRLG